MALPVFLILSKFANLPQTSYLFFTFAAYIFMTVNESKEANCIGCVDVV